MVDLSVTGCRIGGMNPMTERFGGAPVVGAVNHNHPLHFGMVQLALNCARQTDHATGTHSAVRDSESVDSSTFDGTCNSSYTRLLV